MREQLRSVGRLQLRRALGLGILLELLFGGLFLAGGIDPAGDLVWGSYRSQRLGFHSQCIRSFSIIDVL